jgi:hypothetical protein
LAQSAVAEGVDMTSTVSTNGRLTLPLEILQQDGIESGQRFTIERIARGQYRLVRQKEPANRGLVDWLLSCPVNGFFVPLKSN